MTALTEAGFAKLANPDVSSWNYAGVWAIDEVAAGPRSEADGANSSARHMAGPTDSGLGVEFSVMDDALALVVTGDLDAVAVPDFALALIDVLSNAEGLAVLDLTDVSFLGSAGLSALSDFRQAARSHGCGWALAGSHAVLRPIEIMDLDLPACATVCEAVTLATAGLAVAL